MGKIKEVKYEKLSNFLLDVTNLHDKEFGDDSPFIVVAREDEYISFAGTSNIYSDVEFIMQLLNASDKETNAAVLSLLMLDDEIVDASTEYSGCTDIESVADKLIERVIKLYPNDYAEDNNDGD